MSAFVLHDSTGQARSIASGEVPATIPANLTAKIITDLEFDGIRLGTHIWNSSTRSVEEDLTRLNRAANAEAVRDFVAQSTTALQAIIDAPPVTFTTVAQGQTAMRALQNQMKDSARLMRRIARFVLDDYSGND